jgi:hypothetical protein
VSAVLVVRRVAAVAGVKVDVFQIIPVRPGSNTSIPDNIYGIIIQAGNHILIIISPCLLA